MNLTIISTGMPVNAALENMIRDELVHIEKMFSRITGYEVAIKETDKAAKKNCEIEMRVLIPKSSFFCREQADTFEEALQHGIANLTHQLKRQKQERAEIW